MKRDIRLHWFYPYPVGTIWDCLTNPELLKQWSLSSGDFRAEVGFRWMEARPPKPKLSWDGKMYFQVLEVVPLEKLSYSFKGGPREGVVTLDSVVTWTLHSAEGGTDLTLIHSGFKGPRGVFTSLIMELGWKKIVGHRLLKTLQHLVYAH